MTVLTIFFVEAVIFFVKTIDNNGSQNYNRGAKCSKKGRSVSILERF